MRSLLEWEKYYLSTMGSMESEDADWCSGHWDDYTCLICGKESLGTAQAHAHGIKHMEKSDPQDVMAFKTLSSMVGPEEAARCWAKKKEGQDEEDQ